MGDRSRRPRSITTPVWPTARSSLMSTRRPRPGAGSARARISPCVGSTSIGPANRSMVFAEALGEKTLGRVRPCRSQTNGKVEWFNRTMDQEWADASPCRSKIEHVAALPTFLHTYDHHPGDPGFNEGFTSRLRTQPPRAAKVGDHLVADSSGSCLALSPCSGCRASASPPVMLT